MTNVRNGPYVGAADFPMIPVQIRFREKTKIGKEMNVEMSAADLFLLLEFLNQHP